jgi:5-methylcytosine-specific restriction protein A
VAKNFINNNTWIFQTNPKHFDIDSYLKDNKKIRWTVREQHYITRIIIGDEVFLWRSDGGSKGSGGIVARCIVIELPKWTSKNDIVEDNRYWVDYNKVVDCETVALEVIEYRFDRMIRRVDLIKDKILSELRIIKLGTETNYLLSDQEANLIKQLWTYPCVIGYDIYIN